MNSPKSITKSEMDIMYTSAILAIAIAIVIVIIEMKFPNNKKRKQNGRRTNQ